MGTPLPYYPHEFEALPNYRRIMATVRKHNYDSLDETTDIIAGLNIAAAEYEQELADLKAALSEANESLVQTNTEIDEKDLIIKELRIDNNALVERILNGKAT